MNNTSNYAANSPYNKDNLTFFAVKKAMGYSDEQGCDAVLKSIEQYAEERRCEIRSTKTEITVSGASYYVSNDGDDKNDGKSPEAPWKTLDRVSNADLNPCDGHPPYSLSRGASSPLEYFSTVKI